MTPVPETGLPGMRRLPENKNSPALKIPSSSVMVLVSPGFLGPPWPAIGPPRVAWRVEQPFIQESSFWCTIGVPKARVEIGDGLSWCSSQFLHSD